MLKRDEIVEWKGFRGYVEFILLSENIIGRDPKVKYNEFISVHFYDTPGLVEALNKDCLDNGGTRIWYADKHDCEATRTFQKAFSLDGISFRSTDPQNKLTSKGIFKHNIDLPLEDCLPKGKDLMTSMRIALNGLLNSDFCPGKTVKFKDEFVSHPELKRYSHKELWEIDHSMLHRKAWRINLVGDEERILMKLSLFNTVNLN